MRNLSEKKTIRNTIESRNSKNYNSQSYTNDLNEKKNEKYNRYSM